MTRETFANIAAGAAARLNLACGRDGAWRGRCPNCQYGKPTLEMKVQNSGIAISCAACGEVAAIAEIVGIAPNLVVSPEPKASKVARSLELWASATPAVGTPVEQYLRGRGIVVPVPASIRYRPRQRNWNDGRYYPAMIALVERLPSEGDDSPQWSHSVWSAPHIPSRRYRRIKYSEGGNRIEQTLPRPAPAWGRLAHTHRADRQ